MKIEIPGYVTELMEVLYRHNYESYVVGGALRNILLGLDVHDYDLTTNALPEEMEEVFSSWRTIETGIKHGTLTVLSHHHPVEITTYRLDAGYQDHRHPDAVRFSRSLKEDCARRDFTINALCYSPREGILDFFHGQEDLRAKVIRCIGNPADRFDEDALRILRALRFAARLSFTIEPETSRALREKKELLSYISRERIREEFNGFLEAEGCVPLFKEYADIFAMFLPIPSTGISNALYASLSDTADNPYLRLAVLLTYIDPDDYVSLLKELKYSNAEIRLIKNMMTYRTLPAYTRYDIKNICRYLGEDTELYLSYRKAMDSSFPYDKAMETVQSIQETGECCSLQQLAVNGNDMKEAGLDGPAIRLALEECLKAVMSGRCANIKEELLHLIQAKRKEG